jgi:hypothetical protein
MIAWYFSANLVAGILSGSRHSDNFALLRAHSKRVATERGDGLSDNPLAPQSLDLRSIVPKRLQ